jgi:hypothetical protein
MNRVDPRGPLAGWIREGTGLERSSRSSEAGPRQKLDVNRITDIDTH